MQRISGLPDAQIVEYEAQIEAAIRLGLQHVMDIIADRIAAIRTASAHIPVLVAAEQPPADSVPAGDGLPPGQPYVSPDDLASVTPLWQEQVAANIAPIAAQVFIDAAGSVHAGMVSATGVSALPTVGSLVAEQYLAAATNTFNEVGNDLWETARNELLDGFERGESIPQLADRLRQSAGMTARTAVLVGRTQVIEASNAGSLATARVSGLKMEKEWIATPDPRTRPTHLAADGQRVGLSEQFTVGGYQADFPAAPSLPPSERYNCRCTLGYVMPDKQAARALADAAPEPPLPGTSGVETAGQASEVFAATPSPESIGPDVAQALGTLESAGTTTRPALMAATDLTQLQRAWRAEFRRITERDVLIQMPPGASLVTMREYAEGTLKAMERFPETRIREISWWHDDRSSDYAHFAFDASSAGGVLQFNSAWTAEAARSGLLRSLRSDVAGWKAGRDGWSVRGATNPQATAFHEVGHAVSVQTLGRRVASPAALARARRATMLGEAEDALVSREISVYATSSDEEMIAEAFTDVMINGPQASELSREIYGIMVSEYRRAGLAIRRGVSDVEPVLDEFGNPSVFAQVSAPPTEWQPGRWVESSLVRVREDIAEREFRAYVENQERFGLAVDENYGRDLGRSIAVNEMPDDAQAFINGDILTVVRDPDKISDEVRRRLLTQLDALQEANPVDRPFTVRLYGQASPTGNKAMTTSDGIGMYGDLRTAIKPRSAKSKFLMPTSDETGEAVYDLTHEYGHALMFQRDQGALASRLYDELDLKRLHDEGYIVPSRGTLGYYGASDYKEAYAEAFAEWHLSAGLTENPMVLRYAQEFDWRSPLDLEPGTLAKTADTTLSRLTVAQLRALAKERGIPVPSGARKADVVRLLGEPGAPAVAPVTPAVVGEDLSKLTVARLRALARERAIAVPAGVRKADLVRLLGESPEAVPPAPILSPTQVAEADKRVIRAAARERNRVIESAAGTERLLAEIDELIAKKATRKVLLERLDPALTQPGQVFAGADVNVVEALRVAVETGEPAKLRTAVTRSGTKTKIKPIGKAGTKVKFDPDTMESVSGADIPAGAQVTVVRRGSTLTLPDGSTLEAPLTRARVTYTAPVPKPVKTAPARAPRMPRSSARTGAYRLPPGVTQKQYDAALSAYRRGRYSDPAITDLPLAARERASIEGNADQLLRQFAQQHPAFEQLTEAKMKEALAQRAKEAFSGRQVATQLDADALKQILRDGRFKTQFETNTSGGMLQPAERARREEEWFGIPVDADPRERPIYGFLVTGGKGKVDNYGDIRVIFKSEVRSRTTGMVGDSMEHILTGRPSPIDNPDWQSFTPDAEDWDGVLSKLERKYDSPAFNRHEYIEAQIHGGVSVSDIAEVILTKATSNDAALIEALRQAGIPWRVGRFVEI